MKKIFDKQRIFGTQVLRIMIINILESKAPEILKKIALKKIAGKLNLDLSLAKDPERLKAKANTEIERTRALFAESIGVAKVVPKIMEYTAPT